MLFSGHGLHGRRDEDSSGGNFGGPYKMMPVITSEQTSQVAAL